MNQVWVLRFAHGVDGRIENDFTSSFSSFIRVLFSFLLHLSFCGYFNICLSVISFSYFVFQPRKGDRDNSMLIVYF